MGATSWRHANDRLKADWRPILQRAIGMQNTSVDLSRYTRIIPHSMDNRLILEAPNAIDCRALLNALRNTHSSWKCQLHLSAECKANRSLLYHKASFHKAKVEDHGDILVVSSLIAATHTIRVELYRSAADIDSLMTTFLATVPKNVQHLAHPNLPLQGSAGYPRPSQGR